MKQVVLNDTNLHSTYSLVYSTHNFPSPKPKTAYISVPYRSGDLDLTESIIDYPVFENVQGLLVMGYMLGQGDFDTLRDTIRNRYLGRKVEIEFTDETLKYRGRVIDIIFEDRVGYLEVEFVFNLEPYRLKKSLTIINQTISGATTILINNLGMPSIVELTSSGAVQVVVGSNSFSFNAGQHTIPIGLPSGQSSWLFTPTGTVEVTLAYQEGAL